MPRGLHRYQQEGDDHFITFSCHHRLPYLNTRPPKPSSSTSFERTRKSYQLQVLGYVILPEHVYLPIPDIRAILMPCPTPSKSQPPTTSSS